MCKLAVSACHSSHASAPPPHSAGKNISGRGRSFAPSKSDAGALIVKHKSVGGKSVSGRSFAPSKGSSGRKSQAPAAGRVAARRSGRNPAERKFSVAAVQSEGGTGTRERVRSGGNILAMFSRETGQDSLEKGRVTAVSSTFELLKLAGDDLFTGAGREQLAREWREV